MHCTDKYSEHGSIIRLDLSNGWVFVKELTDYGFESSSSHLNFRLHGCFKQVVPWHSWNCRAWIHSETRTWHDKNIQSNIPYRVKLRTENNNLVSLKNLLSVRFKATWFMVRSQMQSLKRQISRLLRARITLTFNQLESADSTLERLNDMTRRYSQIHLKDKYSKQSSIIWLAWSHGWVIVDELKDSGFKSSCSHLKFRLHACFQKGVPWHWSNYRVWTHIETRTWHD